MAGKTPIKKELMDILPDQNFKKACKKFNELIYSRFYQYLYY